MDGYSTIDINLAEYEPLMGSSYIPLPKPLMTKREQSSTYNVGVAKQLEELRSMKLLDPPPNISTTPLTDLVIKW